MAGIGAGMVIGLPPLLNFPVPDQIKNEVVPDVLRGKKFIALAISEAAAGSDVQGLTTTGVKSECGKYYEVTGSKKWITQGAPNRCSIQMALETCWLMIPTEQAVTPTTS